MNHDETNFDANPTPPLGDDLEARVVAWAAGELPPAEVAELEQLAAGNPAIALFKRRMESVQGLVAEAERADPEPLRLAPERRAQLLRMLNDAETATAAPGAVPVAEKVVTLPQSPRRRVWRNSQLYFGLAGAAAACLAFVLVTERRQFKPMRPGPAATEIGAVDPRNTNAPDKAVLPWKSDSALIPPASNLSIGAPAGQRESTLFAQSKAITLSNTSNNFGVISLVGGVNGAVVNDAGDLVVAGGISVSGQAQQAAAVTSNASASSMSGTLAGSTPPRTPEAPVSFAAPAAIQAAGTGNNIYLRDADVNVQGGRFLGNLAVRASDAEKQKTDDTTRNVTFGATSPVTVNLIGSPMVGGGVNVLTSGGAVVHPVPATGVPAEALQGYKETNSLVALDGRKDFASDAAKAATVEALRAELKLREAETRVSQARDFAGRDAEYAAAKRDGGGLAQNRAAPTGLAAGKDSTPVFTAGQITLGAISAGSTLTLGAAAAGKPLATSVRPDSYGGSITLAAPNAAAEESAVKLEAFSVAAVREGAAQALAKEGIGGRSRTMRDEALGNETNPGRFVAGAISNDARVKALARGLELGSRDSFAPVADDSRAISTGASVMGTGMITVPSFGDITGERANAGGIGGGAGGSASDGAVMDASGQQRVLNPAGIALSKEAQISTGGFYASSIAEPTGFFATNGPLSSTNTTAKNVLVTVPAAAAAAAATTTASLIEVPALTEQDKPRPVGAPKPLPAVTEVATAVEAVSTFSLHVADVSFRLAQAALARGERPDPARIRAEEFYNAFDYGDPAPSAAEKIGARVEQAGHPFLAQRNLVRVALRVASDGRGGTPLRLTVLLDTSGSMEREDRAASVRRALEVLISLLGPNDRITLVGFARTPRLLAESVAGNEARALLDILGRTPSEGGTNLEEAIKLGGELARRQFTAGAQNRVVLLTDGAANLGDADPARLGTLVETLRQQNLAFDACGVGLDGLDDEVLESLTRRGDGRYYALNSPADADRGFAQKLAGAFRPAAENVKVQVRFNPARVGHYRLIGFEQHRLSEQDFRNDAVNAAELAADENAVALYQVELLPGGEGELGELFVRFRDPATAQMVERAWTLPYDAAAPAFDRATPTLQLAGASALLAEKFRGGVGETVKLADLSAVAATLRGRYAQDARVQEFVTMIAQARRLYGDAP